MLNIHLECKSGNLLVRLLVDWSTQIHTFTFQHHVYLYQSQYTPDLPLGIVSSSVNYLSDI